MHRDYAASLVGQQFGDYRIEGVLGRGGMGAVLRGRDLKLGRDIALKIIGQEFGGQADEAYTAARDRFLREARTLAGLSHPNLVHLYAVGEVDGKHFFAMELVRGPTLGEWIRRFGPLRDGAASRFCAQMLSALNSVHATGFVHRDIKPGNMMLDCSAALDATVDPTAPILEQLTGDEAQVGRWVLMDFGLAKSATEELDSSLTQQGLILGTPDTMSPEQAQGLEVTRVSDLYSFGAVLYLALSGRLPFSAPSAMGVMQKHIAEPPPDLERYWPEAPAIWRQVTAKSLAKSPGQRFQTESEIAAVLLGQIDDLPELRELARAPRRATVTADSRIKSILTATASTDPVPAQTVSSTAQTIRDLPKKGSSVDTRAATVVGAAAPTPKPKTAPRDSRKKNQPQATAPEPVAAAAKVAASLQNRQPESMRRWPWYLAGMLLLLFLFGTGWWLLSPPTGESPPPPEKLPPLPANAFWGRDPAQPARPVALHWLGLDPTTQTYLVEIYRADTRTWEELSLTHEQMMQYGELKKPAENDPAFPREPLAMP